jgi:putative CocE/NonD family hydrolase
MTLPLRLLLLLAVTLTIAGCETTERTERMEEPTAVAAVSSAPEQTAPPREQVSFVEENYTKTESMIPMRDGVKLFTVVYAPKDTSQAYPMMLLRTPYSCRPYGEENYRRSLGPNELMARDGYIFVYQDVRGTYMSEGEFVNMRPHVAEKLSASDVDEASDTYDTIAWLVDNVPDNNGRVGMYGISYPGFYAAAGMIDAHPALKAVSPQAPIADWWYDDFHHHGAFFLPHCFGFMSSFGRERPEPTPRRGWSRLDYGTPDGYQFFLDLGPLSNANDKYLKGEIAFWNALEEHPNYDEFWQSRNILPHLNNVAPAVMTVGGWYDAEDLYGPLQIYRSAERKNPGVDNVIVMGPWRHGGWSRGSGSNLGNIDFGSETSPHYQQTIEEPFFRSHLKGDGSFTPPEATMFDTGALEWRTFDEWPPAKAASRDLFCRAGQTLAFDPPSDAAPAYDEYISDPQKPVPFTELVARGMTREYMTADQRFAGRRPDVLVFQTDVLDEDVTIAGPVIADLRVSTSGTASDWVVKLIDVIPGDVENSQFMAEGKHLGGYQMMVRSEVIRGRFRNSHERPEPFVPDEPTVVELPLQDVLHTFKAGHRIMIQIQSTWFPLVDRNPHNYVENLFEATEDDFIKATQRVYRDATNATSFRVGVLPE